MDLIIQVVVATVIILISLIHLAAVDAIAAQLVFLAVVVVDLVLLTGLPLS